VATRSRSEAIFTETLPYPATRLTITQRVFVCHSPLAFALYIVGTFYDKDDAKIWEKEYLWYQKDSRNIHVDPQEVDTGPRPPRFALRGK
jgi:hypothetical protein